MSSLEVFADVRCPFAYVGLRRVLDRRERDGTGPTLVIRAWPLELVNGSPMDAKATGEKIAAIREQLAPDLFVGFDVDSFGDSSLPAMALTTAAYRHDLQTGEAVAMAVREALFEHGQDVTDPDVLSAIGSAHGVSVDESDHEKVLVDWEEGKSLGVIGSPHFLVQDKGYFCPGLEISHYETGLSVVAKQSAFDEFIEKALGANSGTL